MYTTLISVEALKSISAVVIDCSADLAKPEAGRQQFEEQHIAGALFADINTDLATQTSPALTRTLRAVARRLWHQRTHPSGGL